MNFNLILNLKQEMNLNLILNLKQEINRWFPHVSLKEWSL